MPNIDFVSVDFFCRLSLLTSHVCACVFCVCVWHKNRIWRFFYRFTHSIWAFDFWLRRRKTQTCRCDCESWVLNPLACFDTNWKLTSVWSVCRFLGFRYVLFSSFSFLDTFDPVSSYSPVLSVSATASCAIFLILSKRTESKSIPFFGLTLILFRFIQFCHLLHIQILGLATNILPSRLLTTLT